MIPSAGLGTRLLPATKQQPKEMLPILLKGINGQLCLKPLLHATFENLFNIGFREFFFITGRGKRSIEDHFTIDKDLLKYLRIRNNLDSMNELSSFFNKIRSSSIIFINQSEPRGFGDAVFCSKFVINNDNFLVHAGDDMIISKDNHYLKKMMHVFEEKKAAAVFCVEEVSDPTKYGVVVGPELEEGIILVKKVIEKPSVPPSNLAVVGIYLFTPEIFETLEETPLDSYNEIQLTYSIQRLIEKDRPVYAIKLRSDELRIDIGNPLSYFQAINNLVKVEIN